MRKIDEIRESGRPIVVSVSGGKDSLAMALYLREQQMEKTNKLYYVYADTGWEHPELYQYIDEVVEPLLAPDFYRVKSKKYPGGMPELVEKRGMFPSRKIRFCTQELKVFPIRDFIKELDGDPINAVGIRAQESFRRSKMDEWDSGGPLDVDTWRPLIDWIVDDVVAIHSRNNIRPCPLYLRDELPASRVGCWPCIMSRKDEIRAVAETDPNRIVQIRTLEQKVADKARERYAKKGETFESLGYTPPTFFQSREGTGAMWPIDKVAEWSRTSWGGKQLELFVPNDPSERGCVLWGLCDMPDADGEFSA
jgi:3'-phosphoadenosine 5'-phosphosulfate sulfotransferase (PAPS reductase)/FAD synthetase